MKKRPVLNGMTNGSNFIFGFFEGLFSEKDYISGVYTPGANKYALAAMHALLNICLYGFIFAAPDQDMHFSQAKTGEVPCSTGCGTAAAFNA